MTAPAEGVLAAALLQLTEHAERLGALDEVVLRLSEQLDSLLPPEPGPGYQPIPAVRWWDLDDDERAEAITRIRDWVTSIYVPLHGHLGAAVPTCWEQHQLILVVFDWLSELWSVLYLQPRRTARDLAAQAELSTRILPAVAALIREEASRCKHAAKANAHPAAQVRLP